MILHVMGAVRISPRVYKKYMKRKTNRINLGFTLVELLVVMTIIGILAVVSLANFRTSQMKARDAQRKSDLRQIANALEAYMSDHGGYPPSSTNGKIKACRCGNGNVECEWGGDSGEREFCDANNTVYMSKVPGDPTGSPNYCYWSDGKSFKLYAKLENSKDPEAKGPYTCAGYASYNFGISSPNISP